MQPTTAERHNAARTASEVMH